MFRTRGRKIFRDVMARKGRTALVSIAIFIGVTGTIALCSLNTILVGQLRQDINEDELLMASVFLTVNAGEELDNAAYIEQLKNEIVRQKGCELARVHRRNIFTKFHYQRFVRLLHFGRLRMDIPAGRERRER